MGYRAGGGHAPGAEPSLAGPERAQLLLLLRAQLVLDAEQQLEVRLLHLALDVQDLARARQRRLLVDAIRREELVERLALLLELPAQLEELLLRGGHLARDRLALRVGEPDLALMLHHHRGKEELLQERRRSHPPLAEALGAARQRRDGEQRGGDERSDGFHAGSLPMVSRRLVSSGSRGSRSRQPSAPGEHPSAGASSMMSVSPAARRASVGVS
jgi:hypothetical protein